MKTITHIVYGLLLVFLATYYACKFCGVTLPNFVGVLALPLAAYVWLHDWPVWKHLADWDEKSGAPKKAKMDPPSGYSDPFWNKPSDDHLLANAQPFTALQKALFILLLVLPFGALTYLILFYTSGN